MTRLVSLIAAVIVLTPAIAAAQPGGETAPAASSGDKIVTITLRDGQLLRGRVLAETSQHIIIELVSGGEVSIAHTQIRDMLRDDKTVFVAAGNQIYKHDPNRTRYLYSNSAFMLRQGEGYFSQTELIASTIGYGVTDWLNVSIGSVLPALMVGGGNFILGARVGGPVSEYVHVSAGFHGLVVDDFAVGLAGGQVTLGTPRAHVTLGAGYPIAIDDSDEEVGPLYLTGSANLRVSKHVALVTENWMLPNESNSILTSLAGRFMGEHMAVDVGFIFLPVDDSIPIPWLDFTYNWD